MKIIAGIFYFPQSDFPCGDSVSVVSDMEKMWWPITAVQYICADQARCA